MDLYAELEIDKDATQNDIKQAYRRLANIYHPDKEGGDEERFKRIRKAYEVLKDQARRERYDETGVIERDTLNEIAHQKLAELFAANIKGFIKYGHFKIVKRIESYIEANTTDTKRIIEELERELKKAESKKGKVKTKLKSNFYDICLNQFIELINQELSKNNETLKVLHEMKNIISEYEDVEDFNTVNYLNYEVKI